MDFKDFPCAKNDEGRRLDKILRKFLPDFPLSVIYKNLRKNLIKINGEKSKPEYKICKGDVISIAAFLLPSKDYSAPPLDRSSPHQNDSSSLKFCSLPPILFENEHLLVLQKPYNLLVQKASAKDFALDDIVKEWFKKNMNNDSLSFTPGPLHRLDRNTTGIICFSKSTEGAVWFSKNLQEHKIQKKYIGIIQGTLDSQQEWKDFIQKDNSSSSFKTVKVTSSKNFNARTIATPIKYGTYKDMKITVTEFDIKTGKTHQIRSQAAFHNLPLLGDTAYKAKKTDIGQKYFLHAYHLSFPQNDLGIPKIIECPLPEQMHQFIRKTCE